ncbi:MAG: hypothetical protein COA62_15220 [Rhodobiaceae bacterium]|nr:MAG: hypothetical protein COA62_15220 [Rhodobiaceae bacterium]
MSAKVSYLWPIIAPTLVPAACADRANKPNYAPPALTQAPASGFPTLDDVNITSIDGTKFRFETTAGPSASLSDVLTVIYCKVDKYRAENGFDAWDVEQVQRTSSSRGTGPQGILAVIGLAKNPIPADFNAVAKDWCAEMDTLS